MNISEIKSNVKISDFLYQIGIQSVKRSGSELFYHSPIRDSDSTPSFTVNDDKGYWFDHGTGEGGSIIDLALKIYNTNSVGEIVKKFNNQDFIKNDLNATSPIDKIASKNKSKEYNITYIKEISNIALLNYISSRGVKSAHLGILNEIGYSVTLSNKIQNYYAIGWLNDSGGYEIRNQFYKACLIKKDITTININDNKIIVFEGLFDYLTAIEYDPIYKNYTAIILNSLSLLDRAFDKLMIYKPKELLLFLDNDIPGNNAKIKFIDKFSNAIDYSFLYHGFKDYNEKLIRENYIKWLKDLNL